MQEAIKKVWSLLIPAMETEADSGAWSIMPAAVGFLLLIDELTPHHILDPTSLRACARTCRRRLCRPLPKASNRLIEKNKEFEGYKSKAYRCPAGVWTCGYGHTRKVTAHTSCTPAKAEEWLFDDLMPIEIFLSASPHFTKTQGRFDACVDFFGSCKNLSLVC